MESTQLLNILINVFYYILLLVGIAVICTIIYVGFFSDSLGIYVDHTSNTTGVVLNEYKSTLVPKDYGTIALTLFAMVMFIKAVYHLRIATLEIIKGNMFNSVVAMNLKWTGVSMIVYKVISILKEQYSNIMYENQITLGLDFEGFESSIFILILGLFFMLLSQVIQNGITLQD